MAIKNILQDIENEVKRAKKVHPFFPLDAVGRCSIMAEEAGEAVKAANQLVWEDGDEESLRIELIQTAAMCVRTLEKMENEQ